MSELRPETMHLIATTFRHLRGIANAIEKFERTVPREDRPKEVAKVLEFARGMMAAAEDTFTAAPTP